MKNSLRNCLFHTLFTAGLRNLAVSAKRSRVEDCFKLSTPPGDGGGGGVDVCDVSCSAVHVLCCEGSRCPFVLFPFVC